MMIHGLANPKETKLFSGFETTQKQERFLEIFQTFQNFFLLIYPTQHLLLI